MNEAIQNKYMRLATRLENLYLHQNTLEDAQEKVAEIDAIMTELDPLVNPLIASV